MQFVVLFTNLPAACGVLPGLSIAVLDDRARQKALVFPADQFGVRVDGRFGQRLGKGLWNVWGFRLHDHWRAGSEQFFYERYVGFKNGSVSTEVHKGSQAASVCARLPGELKLMFSLQKMEEVHAFRAITLPNVLRQAHEHPLSLPRIRVGRAPSIDVVQAPVNEKMVGLAQGLLFVLVVFGLKANKANEELCKIEHK